MYFKFEQKVYLYNFDLCFSGMNGACSVHEWSGKFKGQSVKFKMTSVCGHVMSLDFPGKYNNWDRVDPVSKNNINFHICILIVCKFH